MEFNPILLADLDNIVTPVYVKEQRKKIRKRRRRAKRRMQGNLNLAAEAASDLLSVGAEQAIDTTSKAASTVMSVINGETNVELGPFSHCKSTSEYDEDVKHHKFKYSGEIQVAHVSGALADRVRAKYPFLKYTEANQLLVQRYISRRFKNMHNRGQLEHLRLKDVNTVQLQADNKYWRTSKEQIRYWDERNSKELQDGLRRSGRTEGLLAQAWNFVKAGYGAVRGGAPRLSLQW